MIRRLLLAAVLSLSASGAWAQQVTCATRPAGDNSGACASTAFVNTAIAAQPARSLQLPNDTSTGTTLNDLAAVSTAGNAIKQSASATDGTLGVVSSGAGTSGTATITVSGSATCLFDGAATAADFVVASSTAGQCHDAGNSRPGGNQTIGQVLASIGSSGTTTINVIPNGAAGSGGGAGNFLVNDFCAAVTGGCGTFTPGVTSSLSLSATPVGQAAVYVYFDGVNQSSNTWVLSGSTVTFNAAIPASVQVVEVKWSSTAAGGTVTSVATGTGLTGGPITGSGTISDAASGVTAGSYTAANITVSAGGRITSASNGSSGIVTNYTPVGGDNTSALTTAIASVAASNGILQLPCNTTISVSTQVTLVSNTHIQGCGMFSTIVKKANASTATGLFGTGFVNCSTTFNNISLANFQIDVNGSNQTGNLYPVSAYLMSNFLFDHMYFRHPYGNFIYIGEPDVCGSGPGGKSLQPDGQQFNSDIFLTNSILDGTGQQVYADLFDILKTNTMIVSNNVISNSKSDCGAYEFNTNFVISNNFLLFCPQGIYIETSYNGSVRDNTWSGWVVPGSTNNYTGVWLADANQTYVGGGYRGNHNVTVSGNHFHDVQPTSGAYNVFGVWVTGPPPSPGGAFANILTDNTCYNLNTTGSSTGTAYCVGFAGTISASVMANNVQSNTTNTTLTSSAYTSPGYSSSNSVTGSTITGNVP